MVIGLNMLYLHVHALCTLNTADEQQQHFHHVMTRPRSLRQTRSAWHWHIKNHHTFISLDAKSQQSKNSLSARPKGVCCVWKYSPSNWTPSSQHDLLPLLACSSLQHPESQHGREHKLHCNSSMHRMCKLGCCQSNSYVSHSDLVSVDSDLCL